MKTKKFNGRSLYVLNGVSKSLFEHGRDSGLSSKLVAQRLRIGWPVLRAVTESARPGRRPRKALGKIEAKPVAAPPAVVDKLDAKGLDMALHLPDGGVTMKLVNGTTIGTLKLLSRGLAFAQANQKSKPVTVIPWKMLGALTAPGSPWEFFCKAASL